jgi:multidrug efflux system membrane fusion protein
MGLKRAIAQRPWLLALGTFALVAMWMFSGVWLERELGSEYAQPVLAPGSDTGVVRVQVQLQHAEPITRQINVYGQTAPARTIEINSETEGRVEAVEARRGDGVAEGEVILRLDLRDREARLAQAQASVNEHRTAFRAQTELQRNGYVSETDIAETIAKLETAKAELMRAELDLEHMVIRAPFNGVLQDRLVEIGDFVKSGDEVATFVDNTTIVVIGSVAEQEVGGIAIGDEATAKLITGQTVAGRIRYVAPVANQQTRTFTVELEIENADGSLPAGVTAEMNLPGSQALAQKISPALLTLDFDGNLGVKIVNDDRLVEFHPVVIAQSDTDGVWVAGLPESATIIVVGQGYVVPGQLVEAVYPDTETAVAADNLQ